MIVAARNPERGENAVRRMQQGAPEATVEFVQVDMASMPSIVAFANAFKKRGLPLHVLIQNAGVFLVPASITAEGLEVPKGPCLASRHTPPSGHYGDQLSRPSPFTFPAG